MATYTDLPIRRKENITILRMPGHPSDGMTGQRVIFTNPENIYEGTFKGSATFTSSDISNVNLIGCSVLLDDGSSANIQQIVTDISAVPTILNEYPELSSLSAQYDWSTLPSSEMGKMLRFIFEKLGGLSVIPPPPPPELEVTGVHAPNIEPPSIRVESSVWFDGTGLDGWTEGRDSIWCKNNRAEEAEFVRMDGDGYGAFVQFDSGMLKADEGAWSVLTDLGIGTSSEVRFKVTINGQSAEIVGEVAED